MRFFACLGLILASTVAAARFEPELKQLDVVPLHALPLQGVKKGIADAAQAKGRPLQIGVLVPLDVEIDGGLWDEPEAGVARWRTRIFSADAEWLNLLLRDYHMPQGGELWFYDAQGQRVQGPYTADNNSVDGILSTSPVFSDTAVLEARMPQALRPQFSLRIAEAGHGIRDYRKAAAPGGPSGACERDAICPESGAFRNEVRATARLIVNVPLTCSDVPLDQRGKSFFCSGTLMNNVRQDSDPLLLSANHCLVTACTAPSLSVDWNLQKTACACSTDDSPNQNQSGANLVVADSGTDFTLVRLRQNPIALPTIDPKPYFSGWDASGNGASSGVGLHHPAGDVKKISTFNTALTRADGACVDEPICSLRVNAWQVFWNTGVTEGGSSGSGIWNASQRMIGTLSGGASQCSGSTGNGQRDFYSRLDQAWAAGLRSGLDPDNTGTLTLAGRFNSSTDAAGSIPVSASCRNTPASPSPSNAAAGSSGGGSLDFLTLSGLMLLGFMRRWQRA